MNTQQIARTRQVLGLLGRTRESVPFFYCAAGPLGVPVLLVDPEELNQRAIVELVQQATRKTFVRGRIERSGDDGLLVFRIQGTDPTSLVADLSGSLNEMIPGLRFARIDTL
ncbi:MAG: hypothetical protein ACI8RZ_001266 [Myxococcota bacterium]|jgi:hypothetical protein